MPNVLVAMNPAAWRANVGDARWSDIIVNTDEFTKRNLVKVGYAVSPLEDDSLAGFVVHPVALTSMTVGALAELAVSKKDAERAKNMFALGLLSWIFSPPTTRRHGSWNGSSSSVRTSSRRTSPRSRRVWNYGETTDSFSVRYEVKPAKDVPGTYRNITGNAALSLGLVARRGPLRTTRCSSARTRSPPPPTSSTN